MAIVSTYPPRPCGIGTFSRDLRSALIGADPSLRVDVVSIVRDQVSSPPPEVLSVIRQDVRSDYVSTPALLTGRGIDVVLIEHEYGIFGGEAGSYVLSLVQELQQPFVVTLHTVLSTPTARQAEVLTALCQRAALVTVFTETARRMVTDAGVVAADRVCVVPHGAPAILLANVAERFSMLKYGLSVILVFIGVKMLIVDFFHIPIAISLGVVGGILALTLIINAVVNYRNDRKVS
jgi:glycosyltransferase involved in cell wall biosynthesis